MTVTPARAISPNIAQTDPDRTLLGGSTDIRPNIPDGSGLSVGQRLWRWVARRRGWDEDDQAVMFTTTHQSSILSPFQVEAGLREDHGHLMGWSLITGAPFFYDLHDLYRAGVTSSPNAVIIGDTSSSKSSFIKCMLLHTIERGGRAVVFDRKIQRGQGYTDHGEYYRLAQVVPSASISFDRTPGRQTILNILDPAIQRLDSESTGTGQDELLRLATEVALERGLTAKESMALKNAHQRALERAGAQSRVPVIQDVIDGLFQVTPHDLPGPLAQDVSWRSSTGEWVHGALADVPAVRDGMPVKLVEAIGVFTATDLVTWGVDLALALERYTTGDLSGLINGVTSGPGGVPLNLTAPLLVLDLTALTAGSAAQGLIQMVMLAFLESRWMSTPGDKLIVLEEAYSDEDQPRVMRMLKRTMKRSRGSGTQVISAFHHLSDPQPGSDLFALIRETGVQHFFRQRGRGEAEAICAWWNLDPATYLPQLLSLPKGQHIIQCGDQPLDVVQHDRTELEEWITDTDAAMRGLDQPSDPDTPPPLEA